MMNYKQLTFLSVSKGPNNRTFTEEKGAKRKDEATQKCSEDERR